MTQIVATMLFTSRAIFFSSTPVGHGFVDGGRYVVTSDVIVKIISVNKFSSKYRRCSAVGRDDSYERHYLHPASQHTEFSPSREELLVYSSDYS